MAASILSQVSGAVTASPASLIGRSAIISRRRKPNGSAESGPVVVARRYLISGRVQGVGFRFFVRDAAAREGLGGVVRNLADGRVETQVEGDQAALDRFERAVYQGPPGALVERVEVDDLIPDGRTPIFRIAT